MRTVCEQSVSGVARRGVHERLTLPLAAPPVFKLCFRSSVPFVCVYELDAFAWPVAADRRNPVALLSLLLSAVHQKVVGQRSVAQS
jgi:hypothetical protein